MTTKNPEIKTNTTLQEFFRGSASGLIGYTVCHPFDTIKTRLQQDPKYNFRSDCHRNGYLTFYRGLSSPLISVILEKAILFSTYSWIKRVQPTQSPLLHGLTAGLTTTVIVTPFERIKVRSQIANQSVTEILPMILRQDGIGSLYRGFSATFFREVPGYMVYFNTYEVIKKRYPQRLNLGQSFLLGVATGTSAWLFMYPSDPVKTMMQNENVGGRLAIQKIWQSGGVRAFYRGLTPALFRASILHGTVFATYENIYPRLFY